MYFEAGFHFKKHVKCRRRDLNHRIGRNKDTCISWLLQHNHVKAKTSLHKHDDVSLRSLVGVMAKAPTTHSSTIVARGINFLDSTSLVGWVCWVYVLWFFPLSSTKIKIFHTPKSLSTKIWWRNGYSVEGAKANSILAISIMSYWHQYIFSASIIIFIFRVVSQKNDFNFGLIKRLLDHS